MDSGRQTRRYPGYTLKELEAFLQLSAAMPNPDPAQLARVRAEIAARKDGTSVAFVTPQVVPGS